MARAQNHEPEKLYQSHCLEYALGCQAASPKFDEVILIFPSMRACTQLLLVCFGCFDFIFNLLGRKEAVSRVQPSACTCLLQTSLEHKKENRWTPVLHSGTPKDTRGAMGWLEVSEAPVRICLRRICLKKKERKADKSSSNHQLQLTKHSI